MAEEQEQAKSLGPTGYATAEHMGDQQPDVSLVRAIDHALRRYEQVNRLGALPARGPTASRRGAHHRLVEAVVRKLDLQEEHDALARDGDQAPRVPTAVSDASAEVDYAPWRRTNDVAAGQMWWARTSWWTEHTLSAHWDANGVKLAGDLVHGVGGLHNASVRVLAQFGLGAVPSTGAGRYASAPVTDLFGTVAGWTGATFGDNWSKCWLHTTQTVRGGLGGHVLTERRDTRTLIFLENDHDERVQGLPGFLPFPRVEFYLDPGHPLTIDLDLVFHFQLEGSAVCRFGDYYAVYPATFRTHQWSLQPL